MFAAVMGQLLSRDFHTLAAENADLDAMSRLTRALVCMRSYRSLHQSMHDRLMHDDSVRQTHDLWLEWLRDMVRQVMDERAIDTDRDVVAHLIEAVHVPLDHRRPPHEMIRFIIDPFSATPVQPIR